MKQWILIQGMHSGGYKFCCNFGMTFGIMETKEELNCLYDYYNKYTGNIFLHNMKCINSILPYNFLRWPYLKKKKKKKNYVGIYFYNLWLIWIKNKLLIS
jgi:hypothetical protein